MNSASPCRTYIVYRHELFAQGVRSLVAEESAVEIVGMECDVTRATTAVRNLRPEVILVEEPLESGIAWPLFDWAASSRIVTFSLHHTRATVYDPLYADAGDPVDLVKAIRGVRMLDVLPGARSRDDGGMTSAPDPPATNTASHSDASRMRNTKRDPSRDASVKAFGNPTE